MFCDGSTGDVFVSLPVEIASVSGDALLAFASLNAA